MADDIAVSPNHAPGSKVLRTLAADCGVISIKQQGYGAEDGDALFSIPAEDVAITIKKADLIAIRDHINDVLPPERLHGSGRTTRQMKAAPQGAFYVWGEGDRSYPAALAAYLGRSDLTIVPIDWLVHRLWANLKCPGLVLDHNAHLTQTQWKAWWEACKYWSSHQHIADWGRFDGYRSEIERLRADLTIAANDLSAAAQQLRTYDPQMAKTIEDAHDRAFIAAGTPVPLM